MLTRFVKIQLVLFTVLTIIAVAALAAVVGYLPKLFVAILILVIALIVLKQGTGLGVLRSQAVRRPQRRFVVLTNYASADIRRRCAELGADRVFDKSAELDELIRQAEGSQRRGLDGYLRMLGIRAGFLYPIQKNPHKRLNPADRTLEVLVATAIDVAAPPVEYRDFLEQLRQQWGVVVGGRIDDAGELARAGIQVPPRALSENSERFLTRLESLGLARRLADSVAVVGLVEANNE